MPISISELRVGFFFCINPSLIFKARGCDFGLIIVLLQRICCGNSLSLEPSLFKIQHLKCLLFSHCNSLFLFFLNIPLKGVSFVHFLTISLAIFIFRYHVQYSLNEPMLIVYLYFLHFQGFFYFFREIWVCISSGLPLPYFLLDYSLLILISLLFPYPPSSLPSLALSLVADEIRLPFNIILSQ